MTTPRFYITGGTLPQDAPSYVVRRADSDLFESLRSGEFCYVLDTRQAGKSSLKVRVAARLRQEGVAVVDLDLTRIGRPAAPDQWYYGLLLDIGDQLNLVQPLRAFWQAHNTEIGPLQRWLLALRHVVLTQISARLVLFMDEIDSVRSLSFSADEFFAGIREWYNRRGEAPICERLTFCLLGVAAPTDLIHDVRATPFNIGRRIELNDFTPDEAATLVAGLQAKDEGGRMKDEAMPAPLILHPSSFILLNRALYWTGGHPYLTQRLCRAVAEALAKPENECVRPNRHSPRLLTPNAQCPTPSSLALVDRLCAELFLTARARETDDNLAFVSSRILQSTGDVAGLLTLYRQIWLGRLVLDASADPLLTELKLAGIVRVEQGILRVRNRIYAREFDAAWVRESMPDAEMRRQRAAYRKGLFRASGVYGSFVLLICSLTLATVRQKQISDRNAAYARTAETRARSEAARANLEAANARRELYLANMELAPREWEKSLIGHLQLLLDETRGNENRGWEWGYWNRFCHLEITAIPMQAATWSIGATRDGTRLAIPCSDGVKVCEAASGREVQHLVSGDHGTCSGAAFSPDGRRVAAYSGNSVLLWDAITGRLLLTINASFHNVGTIGFSPDGRRIIATGADNCAKVWDAFSGSLLLTAEDPNNTSLTAFSPDSKRLLCTGAKGVVRILDVMSGRTFAMWKASYSAIYPVAISPDGHRIVTGGADGTVRLWDAATHRELRRLKYDAVTFAIAFSPDGRRLVTGSADGTARVWNADSGRLLVTLRGHRGHVLFVAFLADGRRILTAGEDATVRVWDARNDHRALQFQAHKDYVIGLAFSPDGRRLVTGGGDAVARIWDVATGRKLLTLQGHLSDIYSVAFSPDGQRVVTGSDDSTARIWDAATGAPLCLLAGRAGRVNSVAWSPDSRRVATAHNGKIVKVWDAVTSRQVLALHGHTDLVLAAAFSPDGRRLATVGADRTLKIWDTENGHELITAKKAEAWLWSVAFSPDGRRIITGGQDGFAIVWDATTGRDLLNLQGHTDCVHSVAFTPDGKRIVTGSHDGTMRLWDVASGRETLLLAHQKAVYTVAVSPDGRQIATGCDGGTVQIWSAVNE